MTVGDARNIAMQKYIELWGADWVSAHSDTIGFECSTPFSQDYVYLSIVEDESNRKQTSNMSFENFFATLSTIQSKPENFNFKGRHRTSMLIDLSSGAVTVDEHF